MENVFAYQYILTTDKVMITKQKYNNTQMKPYLTTYIWESKSVPVAKILHNCLKLIDLS